MTVLNTSQKPITEVSPEVLLPLLKQWVKEMGKGADKLVANSLELERIRNKCGIRYHGIPLDDLREQITRFRKAGKIGAVKGHGPPRDLPPSDEMKAYYETDHWKEYTKRLRKFWDYRCAICFSNEKLDGHHRTYERLGEELITDCIAICRKCHAPADTRRRRAALRGDKMDLFSVTEDKSR